MSTLPLNDPTSLLADLDFVRSLARRLCHDQHAAEDVAQETMATAIEKPPADVQSWRGWLAAVARNLAHNHRRGERRRKLREQLVATDRSVPSAAEVAGREQLRSNVVAAVMQLPEAYRTVVLLRHYRGLDTRACAAELGVPENTVRSRLKRGVDQLRTKLDSDHGGDRQAWVSALLPLAMPFGGAVPAALPSLGSKKLAAFGIVVTMAIAALLWVRTNLTSHTQVPPVVSLPGPNGIAPVAGGGSAAPGNPEIEPETRTLATAGGADGWQLIGTIMREDSNRPLAGAHVQAWAQVEEDETFTSRIPIGDTRCDRQGRYRFSLAALRTLSAVVQSQLRVVVRADANGYWPEMQDGYLREHLTADGAMVMELVMGQERLTKGRVLLPNGLPVHEAAILLLPQEYEFPMTTASDGTFAIESPDIAKTGYDVLVVAAHPVWGISAAKRVRIAQSGDTLVGDLVLDQALCQIRGRVRFPDGAPVTGVTVWGYVDDEHEDDPVDVYGHQVENFERTIGDGFGDALEAQTDRDGRFTFRCARPGRHWLEVDGSPGQTAVVAARSSPADVEIEYDVENERAQIHVRIEDRDGRWLPGASYGTHVWRGESAAAAQRRFLSEGPTPSMIASADQHETLFLATDEWLWAEPRAFYVIEASCHGAGPSYAGCMIEPGRAHHQIHIVLEQRRDTGSLQVSAHGPDGEPLDAVMLKLTRVPTALSVPIYLPDLRGPSVPPSSVAPPWHTVPKSGRIDGLPAGELFVEALAGVEFERWALTRVPYPIVSQSIVVQPGKVTPLTVHCVAGVALRIEFRAPPLAADERLSMMHNQAGLRPVDDERMRYHLLAPSEGTDAIEFVNGVAIARCRSALATGQYAMHLNPQILVERFAVLENAPAGRWVSVDNEWHAIDQLVDLKPGQRPVVVQLRRK